MTERRARLEAHRLWQGLQGEYDRYIEAVNYIPAGKIRHQEDMRRYLCLRFSGFLEKVTEVVLLDFIERKSGGPVQIFALGELRIPNLSPEKYVTLLAKFGPEYPERFKSHLGIAHRDALFDLLDIRNKVAHGDLQGGVKLDPTRYLGLVEKIYDWLSSEFLDEALPVEAE